jgi:hypothetical protein
MILSTHGIVASQIASFVGLLDTYPNAAAAYSVRKLRAAYTGSAIRVRRSSDNTETNIGFTALGNLDESALTTFCSGTNGFVTTWYDQSGNGRNATQTTAANQPQIVVSGTIVTQNSKTAIQSNSSFDARLINSSLSVGTTQSIFAVGNSPQSDRQVFFDSYDSVANAFLRFIDPNVMSLQGSVSLITTNTNQKLWSILTATDLNVWENNSLTITNVVNTINGLSGISLFDIRGNPSPLVTGYGWEGKMQEIVIYSTSQSSNRTAIQNNINSYYGIY